MQSKKKILVHSLSIAAMVFSSQLLAKEPVEMKKEYPYNSREAASERMIAHDPLLKDLLKKYNVTNLFDLPKDKRYRYIGAKKTWISIEKKRIPEIYRKKLYSCA